MACVGASQALTVLLIGPVFDRVLNPNRPDAPVKLFTIPGWNHPIFLNSFMPSSLHDVWAMVAVGIVGVFLTKGVCDYCANYLVNYVGFSAVTDLRQTVFDRVLQQDAQFFESNSTARVMSSIMNDLEKIQVALSHILADWLRQSFTALGLLLALWPARQSPRPDSPLTAIRERAFLSVLTRNTPTTHRTGKFPGTTPFHPETSNPRQTTIQHTPLDNHTRSLCNHVNRVPITPQVWSRRNNKTHPRP